MFYFVIKRFLDIILSIVLIILFFPIWIIIPILIKLDSKGPVFFKQERIGKNNKKFMIAKFRTMRVGADDFWTKGGKLSEEAKKRGWKLTLEEDTRVTKLGKILRQTSLDEFPQLYNILMGDMSLVGPRPIREIEVEDAIKRYGKKIMPMIQTSLIVKPGLTGAWQVSGRNVIPWDERLKMDVNYVKRRNLLDDFAIIIKTPLAMISKW